jgi:hypothetical protein
MFEFSKSIQNGLMSLESLKGLEGVDPKRVSALTESVRHAHAEAMAYMVTLIAVESAATIEMAHHLSASA